MDDAGPVSVTPTQVANLVSSGVVKTDEIIRLLVATGTWSDSGAAEIVSTIAQQPDDTNPPPKRADLQWPGPHDDPPPLFAD